MMLRAIVLSVTVVLSVSCRPRQDSSQIRAVDSGFADDGLTFSQLKSDILANNIQSTEQLLEFFAVTPRYQALIRTPVLERRSEALHHMDVSAAYPRILLHSDRLAMHLTGLRSHKGHELIEFNEYLPDEHRFAFRLINFALYGKPEMFIEDVDIGLADPVIRAEYKTSVEIGGTRSCKSCHGERLVPIWTPLSSVSKPFGDFADRIAGGSPEQAEFKKFKATLADAEAGRLYRALDLGISVADSGDIDFTRKPNSTFTRHIQKLAQHKAGYDFQALPDYNVYQYAAVAALIGCKEIDTFLPDNVRTQHESQLLDQMGKQGPGAFDDFSSLDSVDVHKEDLKPEFRDTYMKKAIDMGGATHALIFKEADFVRMANQPPIEAMKKYVSITLATLSKLPEQDLPSEVIQAHRDDEAVYQSDDYLYAVAAVRYLFRGRVDREVDIPLSPTGETILGFGELSRSYRFDGGLNGMRNMVAESLAPGLIAGAPSFQALEGFLAEPDVSRLPSMELCTQLKDASLAALKLQ